jgi:hypothetical protein
MLGLIPLLLLSVHDFIIAACRAHILAKPAPFLLAV